MLISASVQTVSVAVAGAISGAVFKEMIPPLMDRFKKRHVEITTSNPIHPTDIRATWVAESGNEIDRIQIETQVGRSVSGTRFFQGRDGIERKYEIVGYFDGWILSLASSCLDQKETRTLSIVMRRTKSTTFEGMRLFVSCDMSKVTELRRWNRR